MTFRSIHRHGQIPESVSHRRAGQMVLSSSVDGSRGLVQLPTHRIPSGSELRHPSFVLRLLLVTLSGPTTRTGPGLQ